jgi:hypothetical protein
MGGGRSAPPEKIDQCEVMEDDLKKEYGDDFLTNRQKFPITSEALSYLASTPCKVHFGYDKLVNEFCNADIKNFDKQLGKGLTCGDRLGTDKRSEWCLLEKDRLRSNKKCSADKLADKYHSTASKWCQYYPEEEWCKCYNLKSNVCDINPNADGCKYYKALEQNRGYFGEEPKIENPKKPGEMIECSPSKHGPCPYSDGYKILKEKGHCRPRVCDRGYIPENAVSDCEPSYKICEKDINIRSSSDSDIIIACNANFDDLVNFEEVFGPRRESSSLDERCSIDVLQWYNKVSGSKEKSKNPGPILNFNKFPLNKLNMTCLPGRLRWRDSNYRYLIRYTISSSSVCCLLFILFILLMLNLKKK